MPRAQSTDDARTVLHDEMTLRELMRQVTEKLRRLKQKSRSQRGVPSTFRRDSFESQEQ